MEKVARLFSFKTPKMVGIRPDSVLLTFILLIASFFRLYKIEAYMTFLGDEGRDMIAIYNILHGDLTLLGPASSVGGFFLGPIYYYFAAPFLFLANYNPVGPSVMVALFGIATVYLVYKLGKEFFSEKVGLAAAFLYAISPVAIVYSKSSWNPNIVPFFSIVTLYLLYKGIARNKKLFLIGSGFSFGILMQLHYLASFMGVVMFLYVAATAFLGHSDRFINKAMRFALNSISVFLGFVMGFLPFLLFEFRHDLLNTKNILRFILSSEETGLGISFVPQVWHVFERLFAGLVANYPLPAHFYEYSNGALFLWMVFAIILAVLSTTLFVSLLRKGDVFSKKSLFLFLWFFVPLVLFGFYNKDVYDYYLGIIFPLPFLLVGNFVSKLWETRFRNINPSLMRLSAVLLLGILAFMSLHNTPVKRGQNQQVKQIRDISNLVLSTAGERPFNFAIVTGGNSDYAYRYFFKLAGKEPTVIETPALDPERKTVTDQLLIVCETLPCEPLGQAKWEIAGFGRSEIDAEWNFSVVKIIRLKHFRENE